MSASPILRSSPSVWLVAAVVLAAVAGPRAAAAVEVRFAVNDAQVKDQAIAGVLVSAAPAGGGAAVAAETDEAGSAVLDLAPGSWLVSYRRAGYVSIAESPLEVGDEGGRLVTTTLSRMLEAAAGDVTRRVRFVLNWGSDSDDAKDLDAHVLCACGTEDAHVYYGDKVHESEGHRVELDVDDTDWGGPETITLVDPPPGEYELWVHDYLGDREAMGASEVVVRLYFDDRLVTELAVPPDLDGRTWRPFRAVVVEADLRPRLVRFDEAALAAGADRDPPAGQPTDGSEAIACSGLPCAVVLGTMVLVAVLFVSRRLSGRRVRRLPK